ncbi:TIGR04282 family arsenosugar biosynthesis glycosyltransferase [Marixanthomonas spongiae]|uniref:DUF2064 domain-containing protein n=1 Tax=Marixanthomonas spongiae TaxID=2174845 RepID=A0A2U0I8B6_9FLAO|nr:DUF2064 domain-containing protein [Marixanthomonas spongiae]PVW17328.1 DUF2064 domain-containing protein [Marixanthomonas spongiae]
MNNNTAILIFANSAQQERIAKPFRKSADLFGTLNKQTLAKVKKTGLPYFCFSEKEQTGNTFGERYVNAIQSIYNKGFDRIITLGNDTPHLQTRHIVETAKKLQENPIVLGPSKDGGYYMMGLRKSHFDSTLFLKLPWQTSNLNRKITLLFRSKNIQIEWLETLTDIDSVSDVEIILNSFRRLSYSLKKLLSNLLISEKILFEVTPLPFQKTLQKTPFNKGSPSIAL